MFFLCVDLCALKEIAWLPRYNFSICNYVDIFGAYINVTPVTYPHNSIKYQTYSTPKMRFTLGLAS